MTEKRRIPVDGDCRERNVLQTINSSSPLQAALRYAESGLPLFPSVPRAKHPLTQHGFKDATTAPARIQQWWRQTPDANIGIATGSVSGLLVVDIDPRNGGDES